MAVAGEQGENVFHQSRKLLPVLMQEQVSRLGSSMVHVAQAGARGLSRVDDGGDERPAAVGVNVAAMRSAERTRYAGSFSNSPSTGPARVESQRSRVSAGHRPLEILGRSLGMMRRGR